MCPVKDKIQPTNAGDGKNVATEVVITNDDDGDGDFILRLVG